LERTQPEFREIAGTEQLASNAANSCTIFPGSLNRPAPIFLHANHPSSGSMKR
jgi:hypothetical protein